MYSQVLQESKPQVCFFLKNLSSCICKFPLSCLKGNYNNNNNNHKDHVFKN